MYESHTHTQGVRETPQLYLRIPKPRAGRTKRTKLMRSQDASGDVWKNRRHHGAPTPARSARPATVISVVNVAGLVLVLLIPVLRLVLLQLLLLFWLQSCVAVPVAQFLAAMTLTAPFVRSLSACLQLGLVCGIESGFSCSLGPRPGPGPGPGQTGSADCTAPSWLANFVAFSAPFSKSQSKSQINRFIELIHLGLAWVLACLHLGSI